MTHPSRFNMRALALTLAVLSALWHSACSGKKTMVSPAVPVLTAEVKVQAESLSLYAVGSVEPLETVAIKSLVGGVITQIGFSEGQDVKAGQLLIQIDPRPYQAALAAAQAQLAKDKAQAANSVVQAQRYADLVKKDFVTQEQYDSARTQAEMQKALVAADTALVEQAQLNLGYATISAPISGRTGSLLVKRGNIVKANDIPLLVINQLRPIRVSFAVPGAQLPLVQKYSTGRSLDVYAQSGRGSAGKRVRGVLKFFENAVDPATGSVVMKGEFANEEGALWPGQFVDTELVLAVEADTITVPETAVVTGQEGTFAYVVGADKKVEKRMLKVNRTQNNKAVIDAGLSRGETVVIDGQMRLVPGALVELKTANAPARSGK
jgi:membrane fusion protein, multidrug efflux system